jgi:hypothetical protein
MNDLERIRMAQVRAAEDMIVSELQQKGLAPSPASTPASPSSASPGAAPSGWIAGEPPQGVDLAWLHLKGDHQDEEGGWETLERVVLGVRVDAYVGGGHHEPLFHEAGDWRGDSYKDCVHDDGDYIVAWLPYAVPSLTLGSPAPTGQTLSDERIDYAKRVQCSSCTGGNHPTGPGSEWGCTDCLGSGLDPRAFAGGIEQALNDAYAEGRKDEREAMLIEQCGGCDCAQLINGRITGEAHLEVCPQFNAAARADRECRGAPAAASGETNERRLIAREHPTDRGLAAHEIEQRGAAPSERKNNG